MSEAEIADLLLGFERRLMEPYVRKDRDAVSVLLSEDFREFGSSGRIWTKAAMLEHLDDESPRSAPDVADFHVSALSPSAMLVTYRAIRSRAAGHAVDACSLRSSLWVLRDGRWQILFHQGTAVPQG
jgi:hypothetical protein